MVSISEHVAAFLSGVGIEKAYVYPGTSNIPLMEAARQQGLEPVLATREGSAAFMAEASGLLRNKPGVCISTLGPGSSALVNGVAAANLDRSPVIALSGQIAASKVGYFTHQVVDQPSLFAPVTKWATTLAQEAPDVMLRKAYRIATAERPGAVHITINSDVATGESPDALPSAEALSNWHAPQEERSGGGQLSGRPLSQLQNFRRPVILAGPAVRRMSATRMLESFAQSLNVPVVVSPMAKGCFPETDDLYAGVIDMACNDVIWEFLRSADLIIAIGFDAAELIKPWGLPQPVFHIDAIPNTDQVYASHWDYWGDIGAILESVAELGIPSHWSADELTKHRARLRDSYYSGRVKGAINPSDVIDELGSRVSPRHVVTSDVGSHKLLIGQGWHAGSHGRVLMSNGLSSMGFSIPAAIATAREAPSSDVVCMTGDGGFLMACPELLLAAEHRLNMTVVVFVDRSLNRIELKQASLGIPSTATSLPTVDVAAVAKAMDCHGAEVQSLSDLRRVLDDRDGLDRPLVLGVEIDPAQYSAQF